MNYKQLFESCFIDINAKEAGRFKKLDFILNECIVNENIDRYYGIRMLSKELVNFINETLAYLSEHSEEFPNYMDKLLYTGWNLVEDDSDSSQNKIIQNAKDENIGIPVCCKFFVDESSRDYAQYEIKHPISDDCKIYHTIYKNSKYAVIVRVNLAAISTISSSELIDYLTSSISHELIHGGVDYSDDRVSGLLKRPRGLSAYFPEPYHETRLNRFNLDKNTYLLCRELCYIFAKEEIEARLAQLDIYIDSYMKPAKRKALLEKFLEYLKHDVEFQGSRDYRRTLTKMLLRMRAFLNVHMLFESYILVGKLLNYGTEKDKFIDHMNRFNDESVIKTLIVFGYLMKKFDMLDYTSDETRVPGITNEFIDKVFEPHTFRDLLKNHDKYADNKLILRLLEFIKKNIQEILFDYQIQVYDTIYDKTAEFLKFLGLDDKDMRNAGDLKNSNKRLSLEEISLIEKCNNYRYERSHPFDMDVLNENYSEDEIEDFLHGRCQDWAILNFEPGDKIIVLQEFDFDIEETCMAHSLLYRDEKYLDVRGYMETMDEVLEEFDCDDSDCLEFDNLDDFKKYLDEIGVPY